MAAARTRFLIVDKAPSARCGLRRLLEECGHPDSDEAEGALIALDKLRSERFDVVLCDVDLPEMNGLELLARIRADAQLKRLPVLMLTAAARKDDLVRAAHLGAAGYLVRPLKAAVLEDRLGRIVGKAASARS